MFIFLRTPSFGLKSASHTPQELLNSFGEKLVLLKLTRGTCALTALGISQEPSGLGNPTLAAGSEDEPDAGRIPAAASPASGPPGSCLCFF